MLTAFGRFVRKLRIDSGYLLKDMAVALDVTSSYLSAVEMGKRNIPVDWFNKIVTLFNLSDDAITELQVAIEESQKEIQLNLLQVNKQQRDLAFAFARKLDNLNDDDIQSIINVIKKTDGRKNIDKK